MSSRIATTATGSWPPAVSPPTRVMASQVVPATYDKRALTRPSTPLGLIPARDLRPGMRGLQNERVSRSQLLPG